MPAVEINVATLISRQRTFDAWSNIRFHFRRKFAPDSIDASLG